MSVYAYVYRCVDGRWSESEWDSCGLVGACELMGMHKCVNENYNFYFIYSLKMRLLY